MKLIEFKNTNAQRIYTDYINRSKRVTKILSNEDQEDCLMELNSYIYEYIQNHQNEDETTALLNIIERLGSPEITLKEVVAAKKIDQAVRTFNLKHLIQALFLNLRNGLVYIVLFILTIMLASFPILIVLELLHPIETGLFIGKRKFFFGIANPNAGFYEVLGNTFIPVVILLGVAFYFLIIFLLKLVKNKKS
ncbi:hypothetical protein Emtol_0768 [Emticicia oligotrophica DSM 17448]|uniref:DUF1700 domain-containing protein n=1 Tax=Emticicia oligotrophica (strain DSM 17448 / CIP 109782 / MTCC 6937 / GPTSA100-15) TaxID=929562 RepID=A0ABN4AIN6_EMTOG|nr:DUF1700 domain-containing protein [Emticicia oligotrophica]AFK01920.1 hypothetical protein Emtol_0768 [Emticicia oligotrophica DSM 17448]